MFEKKEKIYLGNDDYAANSGNYDSVPSKYMHTAKLQKKDTVNYLTTNENFANKILTE